MPNGKFKILIVDDSKTSREITLSELSHNPKFEPIVVESTVAAIELLDKIKPDCIVSDIIMPQMDGYEFCRYIRAHPLYKDLPFIVVSSTIKANHESGAFPGITAAFTKPFKSFELFDYIDQYYNKHTLTYKYNALLVDDSSFYRALLPSYLKKLQLNIFNASDSLEAEKILKQQTIDLIILDNILVGKTGVQYCRDLRKSKDYQWLPILGLSADADSALSFINAGADDYLSKKASKDEIVIRVQNQIKRIALKKELDESLAKEKTLNQQKNKLLGIATHDIRNPIGIIQSYAELIRDGFTKTQKDQDDMIKLICATAKHTLDLLSNILDISSIESGLINLECETFDLREFLSERVAIMNKIAQKKTIVDNFIAKTNNKTPCLVNADKKCLSQVVDNLISNAIKFSAAKSMYSVYLTEKVEGWQIDISDQGPGIPNHEIATIFQEFTKTSVKSTAGEKSTGLGLAIVKKLVSLHKGTVWVENNKDKGATFSFIIPRR